MGVAHVKGETGDRTRVKNKSVKESYEHNVEKTVWLCSSSPVLPGNFTAYLLDICRYICMCVNIQMQESSKPQKRPQTNPLPKNIVYKMDMHCIYKYFMHYIFIYPICYTYLYIFIYIIHVNTCV